MYDMLNLQELPYANPRINTTALYTILSPILITTTAILLGQLSDFLYITTSDTWSRDYKTNR